ncbi:MAG: DUF3292 domain-containing protein [Planctomycetaceae bacterium]|jgi:hypothetical protein|nr:DUF3292 domain-containing protein [Planctomycetaceae bacterium]
MKEIRSPIEILANRRTIQWLFVPVILLPVGMVFLFTFGRFFAIFGDPISAAILDWLALGLGFFWFLSLVSQLLCVALFLSKEDDEM